MAELEVQLLQRDEIEKARWDGCVHYAPNGNVFGYTWYLDFIGKDWMGLVEGNYLSVFPLIWRKDWLGRKELYQPVLMRELGVFTVKAPSSKRTQAFLDAIPDEFQKISFTLNERNYVPDNTRFQVEKRVNYQLMLNEPYEVMQRRFDAETHRQIQRAEQAELRPVNSLKPEAIAEFFRNHHRNHREPTRSYHGLQRIMYNVLHRGNGFASGVEDQDGNLLAVDFFIFSHGKMLSLVPVESERGRQLGARALLVDLILRSNENRPLLMDFNAQTEDIFAKGFGAQPNTFYHLKRDKRLLKI